LKITDEEGRVWKKQKEIGSAFSRFYQNLFATGDPVEVDKCLDTVEPRVTKEMNEFLLREFTVGEVEIALVRCILSSLRAQTDLQLVFIKVHGIL
jgi:hypothetical protein